MFIWIIVGLFCISFLLSLFSLWRDLKKNIKTEHVVEELSKGRVIFHAPSASHVEMPTEAFTPETEQHQPSSQASLQTAHIEPRDHIVASEHTAPADVTHHENNSSGAIVPPLHDALVDSIHNAASAQLVEQENVEPVKLSENKEEETNVSES